MPRRASIPAAVVPERASDPQSQVTRSVADSVPFALRHFVCVCPSSRVVPQSQERSLEGDIRSKQPGTMPAIAPGRPMEVVVWSKARKRARRGVHAQTRRIFSLPSRWTSCLLFSNYSYIHKNSLSLCATPVQLALRRPLAPIPL